MSEMPSPMLTRKKKDLPTPPSIEFTSLADVLLSNEEPRQTTYIGCNLTRGRTTRAD